MKKESNDIYYRKLLERLVSVLSEQNKTRDTIIRLYEKRRKESDTNDCNKRRKEKKGRFAS